MLLARSELRRVDSILHLAAKPSLKSRFDVNETLQLSSVNTGQTASQCSVRPRGVTREGKLSLIAAEGEGALPSA
jgi:hypothetical protein